MIIHNASITGSFSVNGTNVASITSSQASIDALNTFSSSILSFTASTNTFTASAATTGSNTFVGNQIVSGSLTVFTGSAIEFQVLNTGVRLGNAITDTHNVTGSLNVSGSITTPGTLTAQTLVVQTITSSVDFVTGSTRFGSLSSNTHVFTGSMAITGGLAVNAGLVGIGTASPVAELQVAKVSDVVIAMANTGSVTSGNRGSLAWYNSSNSTVALVRAAAVTDNVGTELQFHTRPAAGSLTQVLTLSSTGTATFSRAPMTTQSSYDYQNIRVTSGFAGGYTDARIQSLLAGYDGSIYGTDIGYSYDGTGYSLRFATNDDLTGNPIERLRINSTGAATFSSTIAASTSITVTNSGAQEAILSAVSSFADGYRATLRLNNTHTGGKRWELYSTNNSDGAYGGGKLAFVNATDSTTAMTITSGGSVGIGTTDPSGTRLRVEGGELRVTTTNLGAALYRTGNTGEVAAYDWGGAAWVPLGYAAQSHIWKVSGTEAMRINQNGYLKVSPNGSYSGPNVSYHEIISTAQSSDLLFTRHTATDPYGLEMQFSAATPNNTTNWFWYASDSTNAKAIIYSNGTFGSRTGTYGSILSDEKYKQDILDASSQWDDIKNLRVVNFKFKQDVELEGENALRQIGFIAQEVEQVSPGLVYESTDRDSGETWKSVKTSIIEIKAIKALQEAMARIEKLETDFNEYKLTHP